VSRTVPARTIRARRTPPAGSSTLPLTRSRTCDARVLNRTPCPGQAKHGKMIFRANRFPIGEHQRPRRPAHGCLPGRNPVAVDGPGSIRSGYVLMSRLPSVGPDTVRDRLPVWPAGRDHRGAASVAATGDQELVTCGLASFRGRAARGVSANSAR
jgi:hypothetical protein